MLSRTEFLSVWIERFERPLGEIPDGRFVFARLGGNQSE